MSKKTLFKYLSDILTIFNKLRKMDQREAHTFRGLLEGVENGDLRLINDVIPGVRRTDKGAEKITRHLLDGYADVINSDVDSEWQEGYNHRSDKNESTVCDLTVMELQNVLDQVPHDFTVWIEYPYWKGLKQPEYVERIGDHIEETDIIDASFSVIRDYENKRIVIRHHF